MLPAGAEGIIEEPGIWHSLSLPPVFRSGKVLVTISLKCRQDRVFQDGPCTRISRTHGFNATISSAGVLSPLQAMRLGAFTIQTLNPRSR